jgi:hypothetical protein
VPDNAEPVNQTDEAGPKHDRLIEDDYKEISKLRDGRKVGEKEREEKAELKLTVVNYRKDGEEITRIWEGITPDLFPVVPNEFPYFKIFIISHCPQSRKLSPDFVAVARLCSCTAWWG